MYSQNLNSALVQPPYFQNRIIMFCLQFLHSYICERFIYFQDRSVYFAASKYVDCGQILEIYKSLTDTWMWNWDWGRAIPRKGIHKWVFSCSAYNTIQYRIAVVLAVFFCTICSSDSSIFDSFLHVFCPTKRQQIGISKICFDEFFLSAVWRIWSVFSWVLNKQTDYNMLFATLIFSLHLFGSARSILSREVFQQKGRSAKERQREKLYKGCVNQDKPACSPPPFATPR